MKIWQCLAVAAMALCFSVVSSAGDVSRGEELSASCVACHGADGNSSNPEWPKLAGQHASYTYRQLQAYKSGDRQNALMAGQVANLSDQDMKDLAAYYESLEIEIGVADPDLVELGAQIFRGGNPDSGVAACIACHGAAGEGMGAAGFPSLKGQHATYTAQQLQKYRSGERATDPNRMMRSIAERMTDDEIRAVSSYIEGLYRQGN